MSRTNTRDVLIEEGLKALLSGSYDGAGIGPILKAADVPKGSFYHFFPSKEAFALAVIETYVERTNRVRAELLSDTTNPPLDRLRRYLEHFERQYAGDDAIGGCLLGNLAQSMAARNEVLRDAIKRGFSRWESDLRLVLRQARDAGDLPPGLDPDETAAFLVDAYEGALIRMKTDGNVIPLKRLTVMILGHLLKTA